MGLELPILDRLLFDPLSPLRELGLFICQQCPFEPENPVIKPRHSQFGFTPWAAEDAPHIVGASINRDHREGLNIPVASVLNNKDFVKIRS